MKYSLTLSKLWRNACRQPSYRSSFLIFLRICSRMSSRATSGASVKLDRRSLPINSAMDRKLLVDPQTGHGDVHTERPKHFLQTGHQFLEMRIIATGKREDRDFVESRCADSFSSAALTIVSTVRIRSGRLITVLWQKRHCHGQPRMISMAMRSCTHSTKGTIGRVGSGMASRSAITEGSIVSGTSAVVRCS